MVFVFWQNIISIHQKAFLEALVLQPGVTKVTLVVEHELTPVRKSMGWETPELRGVEVIMSPNDEKVGAIVNEQADAVHVMGGIRIGRMITTAFDACVARKCRIGIMTEPYDDAGFKGRLRGWKYRLYSRKYFRHIDFVLAIGRQGVQQYSSLGFNTGRLFPWAYFITLEQPFEVPSPSPGLTRIIYAGRLTEAKGISRFVDVLLSTGNKNYRLDIYGTGPDEEQMRSAISAAGMDDKITITRFLKYNELLEKYKEYDWVVLPSTQKDGWGVIVNEGLLNGLKAICSKKCGASWAVKDGFNGVTFDWTKEGDCRNVVDKMLAGAGFATPATISSRAQQAISGEAGAKYFMNIIGCVYNDRQKPGIPWEGFGT